MCIGSWFQALGPATANARVPNFVTEKATTRSPRVVDRSLCLLPMVVTGRQRSVMYDGASPVLLDSILALLTLLMTDQTKWECQETGNHLHTGKMSASKLPWIFHITIINSSHLMGPLTVLLYGHCMLYDLLMLYASLHLTTCIKRIWWLTMPKELTTVSQTMRSDTVHEMLKYYKTDQWQFRCIGLDWIVQCFTSSPSQYRLYGRRFLQVKRPNQQYRSTEGKSTKDQSNNGNNTKQTCIDNNRHE